MLFKIFFRVYHYKTFIPVLKLNAYHVTFIYLTVSDLNNEHRSRNIHLFTIYNTSNALFPTSTWFTDCIFFYT